MEDGTKYGSRPGQTVSVERPDHLAAIHRSGNFQQGWLGTGGIAFTDLIPDRPCPRCGRNAMFFADVTTCAKCGADLPAPVAADPNDQFRGWAA